MTFYANRNNIEPMLLGVALVVMVMLGLLFTIRILPVIMAEQGIGFGQSARFNSFIDGFMSCKPFRMANIILFLGFALSGFRFFTLSIFFLIAFLVGFPFFCLSIGSAFFHLAILLIRNSLASFAIVGMAVFSGSSLIKLREGLDFLASGTSFRYALLRHLLLLGRSKCLEPNTAYCAVSGSFYCK